MITFALDLPKLTESQRLQLEEALLKVPKVDALTNSDGKIIVTVGDGEQALRDAVAAIYGWASSFAGLLLQMKVNCQSQKSMLLGAHSPNDVIYFLTSC